MGSGGGGGVGGFMDRWGDKKRGKGMIGKFWLFLWWLVLFVSVSCVDMRPSPTESKKRALTAEEKKRLRSIFLGGPPNPRFRIDGTLSVWEGGKLVPAIYFYGVDITPLPVERGKKITITYYFKALKEFKRDWGIFLHLEAERPYNYYLNKDHQPVDGLYPTSRWEKGKIFKSSYSFILPSDFPGKKLYLYSGFWRPGLRMIVPKTVPNDGRNRILLAVVQVEGKERVRPIYIAYRIPFGVIKIDGKLDEPAWRKAPSTGNWPTYNNRPAKFETYAKLLWDEKYLYVGIYCEDDDIWGNFTERDQPLFKEEVVEFFIDANRNHRDYIELQVSPRGVIFDSFFERYRWPRPWGRLSYDSGMEVSVSVDGTLNNSSDRDKGWMVEFRLPWSKLGPAFHLPPEDGDEWLVNFYRLERSRRSGGEFLAWSPVTLSSRGGDFHQISKFGTLRFSKKLLIEERRKNLLVLPELIRKSMKSKGGRDYPHPVKRPSQFELLKLRYRHLSGDKGGAASKPSTKAVPSNKRGANSRASEIETLGSGTTRPISATKPVKRK